MNDFSVDERKAVLFIVSVLALGLIIRQVSIHVPVAAELFASLAPQELFSENSPVAAAPKAKAIQSAEQSIVPVNSADEKQLQRISGIGPVLSRRIAEYRALHGLFREPEDLLKVKGIGPKKLQHMKPHISLE